MYLVCLFLCLLLFLFLRYFLHDIEVYDRLNLINRILKTCYLIDFHLFIVIGSGLLRLFLSFLGRVEKLLQRFVQTHRASNPAFLHNACRSVLRGNFAI